MLGLNSALCGVCVCVWGVGGGSMRASQEDGHLLGGSLVGLSY